MTSLNFCEKLISLGYSITPLIDKKPITGSWTSKIYTFDELKRVYKDANNIGLVCGHNDVEVIDIDLKVLPTLKEQKEFWSEYTSFLKDNIDDFDKKIVVVKTKNSGYHLIYRCTKIENNQKIATLEGHKEAIIETRGKGGQVVIYENNVQSINNYFNIQIISERDRDTLIGCSVVYNYIAPVEIITPALKREYKQVEDKTTPWQDYNDKTNIYDIISDDFSIVKHLNDKIVLKRNGSDNPYCGSILLSKNLLYLFTPNSCYPQQKGINCFQAYTYKYHNGDFTASAKDLYNKGFGTRIEKKVKELEEKPIINDISFPIEIFPNEIQNYILQCHTTLGSSIEYMGCAMLWTLSIIFGNCYKIRIKNGWVESCILWLVIVGKQGIGKTPSINNIVKPIKRANDKELRKYKKDYKRYEEYEALDKEEKKNSVKVEKPTKIQFIQTDITLEALVDCHENSKNSIGVFRDEIAGWIKDMNKYRAGSDVEHWLSSWSNESISLTRKTSKSSNVESPCMSVIGGVQPSIFSQFYTDENKENGFIDRLLISYPSLEVDEYNENEIDEDVYLWYNDFIINLYNYVKGLIRYDEDGEILSQIVELNEDAKKEWIRIFNKITSLQNSDKENEYMKSMLPKQKSYIPRFALILHLFDLYTSNRTDDKVNKQTMLNAEKLSEYFITMAKKVKVDTIEKSEVKKVIYNNQNKTKKEQCIEILENNPNINKSDIADLLGVSRQMIYEYLKEN